MFRIGPFSRISQVSIQALRLYDKLGLFKPAHVDPESGYRYYTIDQVPQLQRIVMFKSLGLSLEQVARLVEHDIPPEELRGMLRLRHAQLTDHARVVHAQLAYLETQLEHLTCVSSVPGYVVVLKALDPLLVAGRRIIVPENGDTPVGLLEAFMEVAQYTQLHHAEIGGSDIAVWYTPVDATADEEVEAAVPIRVPILTNERIVVHTLPPVRVASVVHSGSFQQFADAYTAMLAWISANNYQVTGPFREVYHHWEPDHLDAVVVEIQFPVVPIRP